MTTYRPTITGAKHMISAGHYSGTHAGFQILEAGGNAIDAGVAAGMALSILQTDRVNFAGVAPIMMYLADKREIINIDVGRRFLAEVLEIGGSRPAIDSFKAFRGREPSIDALLRHHGMAA